MCFIFKSCQFKVNITFIRLEVEEVIINTLLMLSHYYLKDLYSLATFQYEKLIDFPFDHSKKKKNSKTIKEIFV